MTYSNVFILCTGRCGSTSFVKACSHFYNYTAGHETRSHMIGNKRLMYPKNHIECDNRLSWLLGRLDQDFGNNPFYVHLTRNISDTATSFAKRKGGIMSAYQGSGIIMGCKELDQLKIAKDYIHTANANIEQFLINKSNKMNIKLEDIANDFTEFYERINADGDIEKSLKEFEFNHNSS